MTLRPTYAHRSSRMLNGADLRRYQRTSTYRTARAHRMRRHGLIWAILTSLAMWGILAAAMCVPGWATPRWRQLYAKPGPYLDEQTCDECGAHLDGEHAPECSRFDTF